MSERIRITTFFFSFARSNPTALADIGSSAGSSAVRGGGAMESQEFFDWNPVYRIVSANKYPKHSFPYRTGEELKDLNPYQSVCIYYIDDWRLGRPLIFQPGSMGDTASAMDWFLFNKFPCMWIWNMHRLNPFESIWYSTGGPHQNVLRCVISA